MQSNEKPQSQRRASILSKTITKSMIEEFKFSLRNALNDPNDILFKKSTYFAFENIIQYFPFDSHKSIKNIINSSLSFKAQNDDKEVKETTIKVLFLIVAFFSHNETFGPSFFLTRENSLMINFITKLYSAQLIDLDGIDSFIKLGIDLSLYSTTLIKPLQNKQMLTFELNVFLAIIQTGDSLLNDMNLFSKNILNYINSNMFINSNNIYILRKSNDFLSLLTISYLPCFNDSNIKKLILDIVFKIYRNSYNDILNRFLLLNCKNSFLKIKNQSAKEIERDLKIIISQIEFISKLVKQESMDKNTIQTGFIFNDSKTNGLDISEFSSIIKDFTILFSFSQEAQQADTEAPLLSFCTTDQGSKSSSDKMIFSVLVKDSRLMIQFDQTSFVMKTEEIKLNKTYLVLISSNRNMLGSSNTTKIGIINLQEEAKGKANQEPIKNKFDKVEIKGKFEKADKLLIGYLVKNNIKINFKGKIGPIMFYDQIFEDKTKQLFFKLYNQYEKVAFDSHTNFSFDENQKYQPADDDLLNSLRQLQTKTVLESLQVVIHPSVILNSFKLKQTYRYYDNIESSKAMKKKNFVLEKQYKFKCLPIPENFSTFPFISLKSIDQFWKYEGINVLILSIEYFYTIFRSIDKDKSRDLINPIFDSLELILELSYIVMIKELELKPPQPIQINKTQNNFEIFEWNEPIANNLLSIYEKLMFSFVKLISLICESHSLTDRNSKILQKFKGLLNMNDQIPIGFKNKYSFFLLDPCFYQGVNPSTLIHLFPQFEELIEMQNNNNQDFLTLISKMIEFSYLLTNDQGFQILLKNVFGACDIVNLTIIISMLIKYSDNIEVVEPLLELIYLKDTPLQLQKEEDLIKGLKKDNSKKKYKAALLEKERILNTQIQFQQEMKKKFTEKSLKLLSKINKTNSKTNYTQALILRLIIDDGVFEYCENEDILKQKDSIDNSKKNQNELLINSVLTNFNPSEPLMKCLLLTYFDYDRVKKVKIMKDIEKFDKFECVKYFNEPFSFQKKNFLVNIVNYLSRIIKTNGSLFLFSAKKLYEILLQLIKTIEVKEKRTKENMCWFNHIFESRLICSTFFDFYIQKIGFTALNEFLKGITKSLVKLHPNPFIYSLYGKQIQTNQDETQRILSHFSFQTFSIESADQNIIDKNLQQYCLLLKLISECSMIPEKFEEGVISFIQFLIKTQKIYSNVLLPCLKEEKMAMLEILIEILNKISKDDLNLIKAVIYHKESKKTIAYEFDKRNDPKIKPKDQDYEIEKETTSLVIKILDKYSNKAKWIEEQSIISTLQQEKEEIEQTIKRLVPSSKNNKKNTASLLDINVNNSNDNSNDIIDNIKQKEALNDSFIKCPKCSIDENNKFETIPNIQTNINNSLDNQINSGNSNLDGNSFMGFYDVGINNAVICCKRDLILRSFSIHFQDIYFEDEQFKLIHSNFFSHIDLIEREALKRQGLREEKTKRYEPINLPMPTKIRNYSSCINFTPRIFLKKDLDFYQSNIINISHSYYTPYPSKTKLKTYNNIITDLDNPFKSKLFNLKTSLFECKAELIKTNYITCGTLYLLSNNILFISSKNNIEYIQDRKTYEYAYSNSINDIQQKDKEIIMLLSKIEEVIARRFLYKYIAIEVFMRNGKSYFFNLHNSHIVKKERKEEKNGILDHLNELKRCNKFRIISEPKQEVKTKELVKLWKKNKLSNYDFILLLNKYSGRTYNDLSQYPILPWIYLFNTADKSKGKPIKEEEKKKKSSSDLIDDSSKLTISSKEQMEVEFKIDSTKPPSLYEKLKNHTRDFQFPIAIQSLENKKRVEKKYKESFKVESKQAHAHIAHFRLFYSTSGYVIFFLFRLNPFTEIQINFQSGKFDAPARQFNSVAGLVHLLNNNLDNRELIPEIFSSFEYALNLNYCYYGIRPSTNELIHNIEKPTEISSLAQLPYLQLRLLNTDKIKAKINDWIDNIFGYYQLKPQNNNRMNLFDKYTYAQLVDVDVKKKKYLQMEAENKMKQNEGIDKIRGKADRIISFGQAPDKLFTEQLKKWEVYDGKENTDDDFSSVGNLMGNLNVVWKGELNNESRVIYANLTSNSDFIYTLIIEPNDLHYNIIKIFRNKNEFSKPEFIFISKMKLFKIKMDNSINNKNYILRYPAKYSIFDINNGEFFLTCRHLDNSIKIYDIKGLVSSYITDSFVLSIYRLDNMEFMSGSRNGKLIHWLISYKNKSVALSQRRSVFAHNGMVTGISYVNQHHIIITTGEDRNLFIRKLDTFELMTKISTTNESDYFCDFAFSHFNQIWTLTLDTTKISKDKKCFFLSGFSINGVCFYNSSFNCFNGLCVNNNGVIITSLFNVASLSLYSLEWFHKSSKPLPYLNLQPHDINLKHNFVDYKVGDEFFLFNFTYINSSNTFYIIYGNKVFRIAYDNQSTEHEWFNDHEVKENADTPKFTMGF